MVAMEMAMEVPMEVIMSVSNKNNIIELLHKKTLNDKYINIMEILIKK